MTRYEELSIKIQDCLDASHRTTGSVREMWQMNAEILEVRRNAMDVVEAGRIVK